MVRLFVGLVHTALVFRCANAERLALLDERFEFRLQTFTDVGKCIGMPPFPDPRPKPERDQPASCPPGPSPSPGSIFRDRARAARPVLPCPRGRSSPRTPEGNPGAPQGVSATVQHLRLVRPTPERLTPCIELGRARRALRTSRRCRRRNGTSGEIHTSALLDAPNKNARSSNHHATCWSTRESGRHGTPNLGFVFSGMRGHNSSDPHPATIATNLPKLAITTVSGLTRTIAIRRPPTPRESADRHDIRSHFAIPSQRLVPIRHRDTAPSPSPRVTVTMGPFRLRAPTAATHPPWGRRVSPAAFLVPPRASSSRLPPPDRCSTPHSRSASMSAQAKSTSPNNPVSRPPSFGAATPGGHNVAVARGATVNASYAHTVPVADSVRAAPTPPEAANRSHPPDARRRRALAVAPDSCRRRRFVSRRWSPVRSVDILIHPMHCLPPQGARLTCLRRTRSGQPSSSPRSPRVSPCRRTGRCFTYTSRQRAFAAATLLLKLRD